ncbi:hypothetical protein GCM10010885_20910 [Alicyclobacillus cellulosilyticus]|uniref:SGNH hydrolase-type esterase domain-containing protein n=1 Tax=Alicyclobacillus cellulosilyticus TaxID=1003997 RepID=A0A917NMK9_9BACL|nr:SGNH/GDSL hydrolase family protein [Alicyclobacillus cellulosilyticus]GGJ11431.1 hypothetical protein GCM10010885_20910 [Alicyclobacillus cellulosilyticus]
MRRHRTQQAMPRGPARSIAPPAPRRPFLWWTHLAVAAAGAAAGWALGRLPVLAQPPSLPTLPHELALSPRLRQETVMVVGGSMAHGWADPHDNSFIKRAFAELSGSTNTRYQVVDRTIVGGTAAELAKQRPNALAQWLAHDRPQVVVISWGLLDDISKKTPLNTFTAAIRSEIEQALAAKAVVILATPPVVRASATVDKAVQQRMIAREFAMARSLHNRNVYPFDVWAQMLGYMQAHHETFWKYYGDNWHPNSAGHALAGKLLYNDLVATFGTSPIAYRSDPGRGA